MDKINTIDLFAGCGGLCDGFENSNLYNTLACVEWEEAPCQTLRNHLKTVHHMKMADDVVLRFDIQRTSELFYGWNDPIYGKNKGLDNLLHGSKIDLIIGGPPCQAYSIAGRVRDENGMKDDYRNFLFESYIKVLSHYRPKAFIFENVPGILSAKPTGSLIINQIQNEFYKAKYSVLNNLKEAIIDFSDYGLPQNRKRVIILGLNHEYFTQDEINHLLNKFYNEVLPSYKVEEKNTVRCAIGNLPKLYPTSEYKIGRKRYSHLFTPNTIPNHEPRWHSERDQKIFKLLASDIESGRKQYVSSSSLKDLYAKVTGRTSNVHKYHVLRWDEPSNLIPAHLYKDGLRHIHPDSKQARTITVREAARLQGFSDDFIFIGSQADNFKMIGNAVPPLFSEILAKALYQLLFS